MNTMKFKIKNAVEVERSVIDHAVKSMKSFDEYSDYTLSVLGVPFGGPHEGRDSDGEAFTPDTNIWLKAGDEVPVTYYHGFGPDDPDNWQDDPVAIGRAKYAKQDERGHWFDVRLDENEELAQRVLISPGTSRASSGAVGHLVRKNADDTITVWPVGELALFDTNEWRLPANDFAVIEAKADEGGLTAETDEVKAEVTSDVDAEQIQPIEESQSGEPEMEEELEKSNPLTKEDIKAMLDEAIRAIREEEPAIKSAPAVVKSLGERDPKDEFLKYIRYGTKAALQEGSATEGGYIVPDDFLPEIIAKRDELSIARQAGARIIQTSRDVINIPYEDTSQTAFAITDEEGAVSEAEPTFGNVTGTVYKFTKLVKVSEELLEDEDANLMSFLADSFGRAWAGTENTYVIAGNGSGQPQGILSGGTSGLSFDTSSTIGAAEIPELYYKLGAPYTVGNVGWVMENATLGVIMGLKGDAFQFMPTPAGSMSPQLLGKPVFVTDAMESLASGKKSVAVGNWSYYALIERKGLSIRRLNELYAGNGQVGFLATVRMGGAVLQAEAFQYATHP